MGSDGGLGRDWGEILETLRGILPYYDRMNRIMSLGTDVGLREWGVRLGVREDSIILDAGCGPGNMSEAVYRLIGRVRTLVLLDPLDKMLETARRRLTRENSHFVLGVFEALPFREAAFDSVLCGYSLRDARLLTKAMAEIHRVLKTGGRLVDVDLGKPDNPVLRLLVGLYWRFIVPLIATLQIGRRGVLYAALYRTYRRHPTNQQLKRGLEGMFRRVVVNPQLMGGALVVIAEK